jgi:phage tail sheath gpL-like
MSGNISFNFIPQDIYVPGFYVELSADAVPVDNDFIPLLVGQYSTLGAGITEGEPVFIASPATAAAAFGPRSMLTRMFSVFNLQFEQGAWCVPVADAPTSVAATGSITFTGPAVLPGTIPLYVHGVSIPVGVMIEDTATDIATNVAAAINAVSIPIVATAAAGVVTLTSLHKGQAAGDIDVRLALKGLSAGEMLPSGVTAAIVAMSGGELDPDLAFLDTALAGAQYDFILHPYTNATALGEITALMNDSTGRWSWAQQQYGEAYAMTGGTLSSLMTLGNTIDDQHQVIIGVQNPPNPAWDWVADWGGAECTAINADVGLPTWTLQMLTVQNPALADRWNETDQQALINAGIAVPNFSNTSLPTICRSVTTYKTTATGVRDLSYQDDGTLFILSEVNRTLRNMVLTNYARVRLVPDGTSAGAASKVVTPKTIMADIAAEYAQMETDGLVTSAAFMTANTMVQIDQNNPKRVNVLFTPAIVNGLAIFAMKNQFTINPPLATAAAAAA